MDRYADRAPATGNENGLYEAVDGQPKETGLVELVDP
jgi:hypothetical protein